MKIIFALLGLSLAITAPSHPDVLYVTVGETFKKTTAEFFGVNEKWSFEFQADQPAELSFDNRDFVQAPQTQAYQSSNIKIIIDVNQVIISKPYLDYHNYQQQGQFAILNLNPQGAYELRFNSVPSQSPIFDKNIKLTEDDAILKCFDFDFYSSSMIVVLCTSQDQNLFSFHMLQVNLVTEQITIKINTPAKVYTEIPKVKFQIVHQTQYTNTKFIYLAVPAYRAATQTYESGSIIERYILKDDLTITFDRIIDGASLGEFFTRKTLLCLVDFLVIGETTYVLDKDPINDLAYIYVTMYATPTPQRALTERVAEQITLKNGQSAFFDGSVTFLHVEGIYTSANTYYTSIIFKEDEQPYSYSSTPLPVYSQITYKDLGSNIVGKITQNYKLILDTQKKTLQVQNLYTKSYEKFIQFDENVYGLLVDQATDSFIILFFSHSQRYQIQEPYVFSNPTQPTVSSEFMVRGTTQTGGANALLSYQVLAKDDYKLYLQKTGVVTIDAKFWTDYAISSQPIVTSGPNPFVEFSAGFSTKLTAYAYETHDIQLNSVTIQGNGIHAIKKVPNGYYIVTQLINLTQKLLFCGNFNCGDQAIEFQQRDTILQYQFSQASSRIDFGVLTDRGLDLYNNQKFEKTLSPVDPILSFCLTGELLFTADGKNVLIYTYQIFDVILKYTINQELVAQLGYDKVFQPKQIFLNSAQSTQLLILNSNQDLIVGKYDISYRISQVIQTDLGAKKSVAISQNGFVLLQYGPGIQKLSQYILEQGVYKLIIETTITDYTITSDLSYDLESSVFAVNALYKNDPVLLIFDTSKQQRDQLLRVIPISKANTFKNPQLMSFDDQIQITGFIGQDLEDYIINKNQLTLRAETTSQITTFTAQDMYHVSFKNEYSVVKKDQKLRAELYFNKIWKNQIYTSNELPRVNSKNDQILKLPNDLFIANIFDYSLRCNQCGNQQIYIQKPLQYQDQQDSLLVLVGKNNKCLGADGIYICVSASSLKTIDKDSKTIQTVDLNQKGVYLYRLGSTPNYLVTLTDQVLIYDIQDGKMTKKGQSNLLINYKDQLTYSTSRIIAFHYNQQIKDGYQILDLNVDQDKLSLSLKIIVPLAGIKAFAYDSTDKYIVTAFENSQLITQTLDLSKAIFEVGEQTVVDVMGSIQNQGIKIIDLQITYVVKVLNLKDIFLIYDIDGTGYKYDVKLKKVFNIYPSSNNEGTSFDSVQIITNQFILVSRKVYAGNQMSLYNFDESTDKPNDKPSLMLQALKTTNSNSIIQIIGDQIFLLIQEEEFLKSYKVMNEVAIVVKDGEKFKDQALSIDVENHFERSSVEKQLKSVSSSSSDAWIWIVVTLSVAVVGGTIAYFVYRRHKKNQQTGLLY